jgi:hypothetical protein
MIVIKRMIKMLKKLLWPLFNRLYADELQGYNQTLKRDAEVAKLFNNLTD